MHKLFGIIGFGLLVFHLVKHFAVGFANNIRLDFKKIKKAKIKLSKAEIQFELAIYNGNPDALTLKSVSGNVTWGPVHTYVSREVSLYLPAGQTTIGLMTAQFAPGEFLIQIGQLMKLKELPAINFNGGITIELSRGRDITTSINQNIPIL